MGGKVLAILVDPGGKFLSKVGTKRVSFVLGERLVGVGVRQVLRERHLDVPRPFENGRAKIFIAGDHE